MHWYWYYLLYAVFEFGFSEINSFPKEENPSKSNFNYVLPPKEDNVTLEDVKSGTMKSETVDPVEEIELPVVELNASPLIELENEQNAVDVAQVEAAEPRKSRRSKTRKQRRREKLRRQEDALERENLNKKDEEATSIEELFLRHKNSKTRRRRSRKNNIISIVSIDDLFEMAEAETDPKEKMKYLGLIEFLQNGHRKKLKIPMKRGLELEGFKEKAKSFGNAIAKLFSDLWGKIKSIFTKNKESEKTEIKENSSDTSFTANKRDQSSSQSTTGFLNPAGTVGKAKVCGPKDCRPITVPGTPPEPPPTTIDSNVKAASQGTDGPINRVEIPVNGGERQFKEIAQRNPVSIVYFSLGECKACDIALPALERALQKNNDIPLVILDCGSKGDKETKANNEFQGKLRISQFPAIYAFQKDQMWARVRGYNKRTFDHFIAGMRDGFQKPEFKKYLENLRDWKFGPNMEIIQHSTNNEHDRSVPNNF